MRISDWSSDVCSSDLRCRVRSAERKAPQPREPHLPGALRVVAIAVVRSEQDEARPEQPGAEQPPPRGAKLLSIGVGHADNNGGRSRVAARQKAPEGGLPQIGRASCRERVCQYV